MYVFKTKSNVLITGATTPNEACKSLILPRVLDFKGTT
jgi:hypothetical protein